MSGIVFLDTETLGVRLLSPIWEVAAIRRNDETGAETELHLFVRHESDPWYQELPPEFRADYDKRYDDEQAVGIEWAAELIHKFIAGRPHVVGAVPNFDTERISYQLLREAQLDNPWHYHLIDVENLIVGYLAGRASRGDIDAGLALPDLPWSSDDLSLAVGVNPENYERHTAMGDVLWVKAQYDAVMGGVV